MFTGRFDMRAPDLGASTQELYQTAIEIAAFTESRGALSALLCERHSQSDGYLPSPMVLATAMAARTSTLAITTAALILPLYDPIRLADMVVLDTISGGRVSYIMAVGYRPEEFEHHGVDFVGREHWWNSSSRCSCGPRPAKPSSTRGAPHPRHAGAVDTRWASGHVGQRQQGGRSTSRPLRSFPPRPGRWSSGGGSLCRSVPGRGPRARLCLRPAAGPSHHRVRGHDVDAAWEELGPHLLHDVLSYASMNVGNTHTVSLSTSTTIEELRAQNRTHRIIEVEEAKTMVAAGMPISLQPLCGGLPSEVAFRYLRVVTEDVLGHAWVFEVSGRVRTSGEEDPHSPLREGHMVRVVSSHWFRRRHRII